VRGHHDISRGDGRPLLRGDPTGLSLVEPDDARSLEDLAAASGQVRGEAEQILPRVELRLFLDPYGAGNLERQVGVGDERRRKTGLLGGCCLSPDLLDLVR